MDLCEILNKSGYAEDYIRARFKYITGKTPVEFLSKVRISHACVLMDTYKSALTLNEISEKCGDLGFKVALSGVGLDKMLNLYYYFGNKITLRKG